MHNRPQPREPRPALRNRLLTSIWTIPAVVLPLLGASLAWFAYDEYEQTIEQEYRFLEAHTRIAESQLSGLLRNIKHLLKEIADERADIPQSGLAAYEETLVARKREFPELRTLAVLDAQGHVEVTVNPSLKGFDGSRRDYFTAHLARPQEPLFHISRPFKSSFGDYSVTFSVARRNGGERLLGVVVAGVKYTFFNDIMKPILPPGEGSIAGIFNREGDLIYRLPDPERHVGASIATGAVFQAFKRSGQSMVRAIGIARIDGVERIYVNRAIGDTGLGVSVGRPLSDVLAEWRRNLFLRIATFVLAAAVTLRLAWVAHRRQQEVLAGKQAKYQDELSRRLIAIQEDERRRLAVELHDRTNPNLTALGINFKMLVGALPQRAGGGTNRLLEDTAALLDDTIASIRAVSIDFRPPLLDHAGLWPALLGYARQFSRHNGIAVHAGPDELRLRLAPDVETHLFRIVQEALANCAKHSRAKTVRIEQNRRGDVIEIAIADDGIGFDPQAGASGQGMNTMRQRAEFIGGKFAVDSGPGRGTRIIVEFAATPFAGGNTGETRQQAQP